MGMILRIASSRIVGQGDIVGRSGYFSLNLSANSVMRGRLDARRTLKSLVADLRVIATPKKEDEEPTILRGRVEFFNESRGFGFIKDLSGVEKYFFHVNNVIGNIAENNIVTFDLERGVKGMNAVNISLENKSKPENLAQTESV